MRCDLDIHFNSDKNKTAVNARQLQEHDPRRHGPHMGAGGTARG
jgi:hypothetical protein